MKSIVCLVFICLTGFFHPALAQETQSFNNQQARKSPEWLTKGVMYQIQPRAFTSEGTLKAATARLKSVADLGVTIAYLCPVFAMDGDMDQATWSKRQKASGMNSPYNPYRMKDFYHVDPEFGSDNDLKAFVKEAHRLGLKVMLDMVYLHAGSKAVFLKNNPDFITLGADGKPQLASWNWPKLNYENPKLRKYLLDNMKYWVKDFDVDGFRCDVSDGVPLDFWEDSRKALEVIRPDVATLAEGERPADQLKAFDVNYSFTWFRELAKVYSQNAPASTLQATWEKMAAARPKGARFIRYIDNHDISNDDYYKRTDEGWGAKGVEAALVLSFALDGVPFVYNGQEVADKARHSIFGKLPVHWFNINTEEGKQRQAFLKELIKVRRAENTLALGTTTWVANDAPNEVVSFVRELNGEQILTVINLKDKKVGVKPAIQKSATPILSGRAVKSDGQNSFELEGFGYWVGKIKK
jgi:cyclomaltodextrinase